MRYGPLRAIELGEQLRYNAELGKWLSNLAGLYLAQGRLDEAGGYARRALAIKETMDLSAEPWTTYAILAQIAEARGRDEEAADWRRKEQESYAAYAGAGHEMQRYEPLIRAVVAACQGDEEKIEWLENEFPKMEAGSSEWARNAAAIRHILQGEHDGQALTEGLGRTGFLLIRAILARLSGEAPPAASQGAEGLPPEAAAILEPWSPIIAAVVAACAGNEEATAGLEPHLQQLAAQDDWRALAAALRRLLAGERDPAALLAGLDDTDRLIVGATLAALQGPPSGGQEQPQQLTPQGLVDLVGQACRPEAPAGLGAQLHALTRQLQNDTNMPPELRALGRALHVVLSGERQPDLAGLPDDLAAVVQAMLAELDH